MNEKYRVGSGNSPNVILLSSRVTEVILMSQNSLSSLSQKQLASNTVIYLDIWLPPASAPSTMKCLHPLCLHSIHLISEHGKHFHNFQYTKLFFFFLPYTSAINMSPCCCESRHSPLLIWCVSRRSAVTELQRDKGALLQLSDGVKRSSCHWKQRERSWRKSLMWVPDPHTTEDRKLHYSGQKGAAETLPPKKPGEERVLYKVTAVLPSLLSREHSDLLHNGPGRESVEQPAEQLS